MMYGNKFYKLPNYIESHEYYGNLYETIRYTTILFVEKT